MSCTDEEEALVEPGDTTSLTGDTETKPNVNKLLDDNSNDSSVVLIPASPTETAAGKDTVFLYMAVDGFTYTNDKQSEVKQIPVQIAGLNASTGERVHVVVEPMIRLHKKHPDLLAKMHIFENVTLSDEEEIGDEETSSDKVEKKKQKGNRLSFTFDDGLGVQVDVWNKLKCQQSVKDFVTRAATGESETPSTNAAEVKRETVPIDDNSRVVLIFYSKFEYKMFHHFIRNSGSPKLFEGLSVVVYEEFHSRANADNPLPPILTLLSKTTETASSASAQVDLTRQLFTSLDVIDSQTRQLVSQALRAPRAWEQAETNQEQNNVKFEVSTLTTYYRRNNCNVDNKLQIGKATINKPGENVTAAVLYKASFLDFNVIIYNGNGTVLGKNYFQRTTLYQYALPILVRLDKFPNKGDLDGQLITYDSKIPDTNRPGYIIKGTSCIVYRKKRAFALVLCRPMITHEIMYTNKPIPAKMICPTTLCQNSHLIKCTVNRGNDTPHKYKRTSCWSSYDFQLVVRSCKTITLSEATSVLVQLVPGGKRDQNPSKADLACLQCSDGLVVRENSIPWPTSISNERNHKKPATASDALEGTFFGSAINVLTPLFCVLKDGHNYARLMLASRSSDRLAILKDGDVLTTAVMLTNETLVPPLWDTPSEIPKIHFHNFRRPEDVVLPNLLEVTNDITRNNNGLDNYTFWSRATKSSSVPATAPTPTSTSNKEKVDKQVATQPAYKSYSLNCFKPGQRVVGCRQKQFEPRLMKELNLTHLDLIDQQRAWASNPEYKFNEEKRLVEPTEPIKLQLVVDSKNSNDSKKPKGRNPTNQDGAIKPKHISELLKEVCGYDAATIPMPKTVEPVVQPNKSLKGKMKNKPISTTSPLSTKIGQGTPVRGGLFNQGRGAPMRGQKKGGQTRTMTSFSSQGTGMSSGRGMNPGRGMIPGRGMNLTGKNSGRGGNRIPGLMSMRGGMSSNSVLDSAQNKLGPMWCGRGSMTDGGNQRPAKRLLPDSTRPQNSWNGGRNRLSSVFDASTERQYQMQQGFKRSRMDDEGYGRFSQTSASSSSDVIFRELEDIRRQQELLEEEKRNIIRIRNQLALDGSSARIPVVVGQQGSVNPIFERGHPNQTPQHFHSGVHRSFDTFHNNGQRRRPRKIMATVCGGGAAPECLRGKQCTTVDALSQVSQVSNHITKK